MSSRASWPTSRASIRDVSDFEPAPDPDLYIEPKIEQPKSGAGGAQTKQPLNKVLRKPKRKRVNVSHEKSGWHEQTLVPDNSWGRDLDNWGSPTPNWGQVETWATPGEEEVKWGIQLDNWARLDPYSRLRESVLSRPVPIKKRVMRWIRDMAKAEGLEFDEESGLDDDGDPYEWTKWGADEGDDWKRPAEEWGFPVDHIPLPAADEEDPQATADFKFVEKIAKKRGLKDDRRRLHAFYRLPTNEKVQKIQEMVHFIHTHM